MNIIRHTSPGGRPLVALGAVDVLTMDRLHEVGERFDRDPRLASVGVVPAEEAVPRFAPATSPAGVAIVLASDLGDITPQWNDALEIEDVTAWSQETRQRGFFHEWWLHPARDVARHPMLLEVAEADQRESAQDSSALADSMPRTPQALSLTIDTTWLGPHQTGAQVLTTEAIRALAQHPDITRIELVGISELPTYAADLATLDKVAIATSEPSTTDIYWFPNQWDYRNSLDAVNARRVITTYLDFIAYGIDSYHGTQEEWIDYRALQRAVALLSDGVTTISADVAHQLLANVPLMDPRRVKPIALGVDHLVPAKESETDAQSSRPEALPADLRPFLLVLGNDFRHKNRDFAIKVWSEILDRGISCDLVLAGLHVRGSSSRQAEQELLATHVNLRGDVHRLGHVDEETRVWLLANAAAVVYPSSAEGFGFVPFEAASLGTASCFVSFGSLRELTHASGLPKTWSVAQFADDVAALVTDAEAARQRITQIQASSKSLTWENFAAEFVDFARSILAMPKQVTLSTAAPVSTAVAAPSSRRSVARIVRRIRRWNQ